MFKKIRELLGADATEPPTPADVRKAIDETEHELARARDQVAELEAGRGDVLLYGSDEDAEEHDAKLAAARRQVDRLQAARERLDDKLEAARDAQERARLEDLVGRAREGKEEYADLVAEVADLNEELVPILERMLEIERLVDRARREAEGTEFYQELTSPNADMRPGNRSIPDVAIIPPAVEDGASWRPEGAHRIAFRKPIRDYAGEVHELEEGEPGTYDGEGNRVEASGPVKVRR